jgi:DNA-directed RNA polymerase subunit beta
MYLVDLINSKAELDDIDHLSNRRVRTVGEQLYGQFGVGLARMARTIRERMNVRDNEVFTPIDLINARTLSSVMDLVVFQGKEQVSRLEMCTILTTEDCVRLKLRKDLILD